MDITMRQELRPCRITITETTKQGSTTTVKNGLFHTWATEAWTYSPIVRGQVGGQMQKIYGVVELEDGSVGMFLPSEIQFLDRKADEYCWN